MGLDCYCSKYIVFYGNKGWNKNEGCREKNSQRSTGLTKNVQKERGKQRGFNETQKNDDEKSRIKYWKRRKKYDKTMENKREE
jgi:hypothetical protein